ncbi:MAG TPA: excisionase family DNA-binding protein [Myxococcota bacterium]|nr:excisionase family DNA-binding protein [Myxococcota bacterium]
MLDVTNPSPEVARTAEVALRSLSGHGGSPSLRLHGEGKETTVDLPHELLPLLVEVLGQLANGNGVRVVPIHAELTTQQAADILNVSRPHLVKLLEAGSIPFHLVGTHRRVRLGDLLVYKRHFEALQDAALAELTAEAQRLGLD